jgi:hypothetical protein
VYVAIVLRSGEHTIPISIRLCSLASLPTVGSKRTEQTTSLHFRVGKQLLLLWLGVEHLRRARIFRQWWQWRAQPSSQVLFLVGLEPLPKRNECLPHQPILDPRYLQRIKFPSHMRYLWYAIEARGTAPIEACISALASSPTLAPDIPLTDPPARYARGLSAKSSTSFSRAILGRLDTGSCIPESGIRST